jgi:programmed cell death 6-interacting protein
MGVVKENLIRAERDNNLIYHNVVPSLPSLLPISPASIVKSDIPSGLQDPQSIVQSDAVIFGELLAWGAKEAIGE